MKQDIISKLKEPFPFEEVEAKIQVTTGDKTKGMAVFYIDSRAIQNRLDEAVGALNWSNSFSAWQGNAQICGISIFNAERGEWVTKHDGAENSNIEAIKGGLTDAFKRAAVLWGIGRYLYQIDGVWVDIEQRGKSSYIKDNQQDKLKTAYETAVKRIFGAMTTQQLSKQQVENQQSTGQQPSSQQPATPSNPTDNPQQPTTQGNALDNASPMYEYKIQNMKPSGNSSQLLELCNPDGEVISAYIRNGEEGIVVGAHLKNVRLEAKNSKYKDYNLIAAYELTA